MEQEKELMESNVAINEETGEIVSNDIDKSLSDLEKELDTQNTQKDLLSGLSSLLDQELQDQEPAFQGTPYTTEIIENIKKLQPSLTTEQLQELIIYVQGKGPRPQFMDIMMTQTNDKLNEVVKLMVILQLLRIPTLVDYQATLRNNLLQPESLAKMTYEEMSKISANIQKEITDTLSFSLRTVQAIQNQNQVPTKIEKLANALMGVSDATRDRIEEILKSEM